MSISKEAKVGLFVLVAVIVLAYLTLQVGEFSVLKRGGQRIKVEFDSVEGLEVKAAVRMAGVRVGEVERIGLSGRKALVTLRLDPGVEVYSNYRVTISSLGLLGEKYVEITPREGWEAKATGEIQPAGEKITEKSSPLKGEAAISMERLLLQLNSVADDVKSITSAIRGTIGTPEGQQQIRNILRNLDQLTANLNITVADKKDRFGNVIDNFYQFSKDLNEIISKNKGSIDGALGKSGEIAENLRIITAGLKEAFEKPENIQQTIKSIKEASAKLERILDRVDKGEGTIGKLFTDEEAYENLNESLKGVKKFLGAAENLKLQVGYRGEALIRDGQLKSVVSFKLQPKEDKYFQFDIVDDPRGDLRTKRKTKFIKTALGPRITQREYEEIRTDKVKFSAFVAKRFWDFTIRGGLIESTGGLGVDYHLWNDRIKLSFDAWDFGRKEEVGFNKDGAKWVGASSHNLLKERAKAAPHLKAGATWQINENIFIAAGVDELAHRKRITPFVAGGIIFTDEDLKWLLGRLPWPAR